MYLKKKIIFIAFLLLSLIVSCTSVLKMEGNSHTKDKQYKFSKNELIHFLTDDSIKVWVNSEHNDAFFFSKCDFKFDRYSIDGNENYSVCRTCLEIGTPPVFDVNAKDMKILIFLGKVGGKKAKKIRGEPKIVLKNRREVLSKPWDEYQIKYISNDMLISV